MRVHISCTIIDVSHPCTQPSLLAFSSFVPQNDKLSHHGRGAGLLILLAVATDVRGLWL